MKLDDYSMEDLILAAMKAEQESEDVYMYMANKVNNALLKARFVFLAEEETKHKMLLAELYKDFKPGEDPKIPDETPVPMVFVQVESETQLISEIIENAMEAEKAATEFYTALASKYDDERKIKICKILASMEEVHYRILSQELANVKDFESYDEPWEMMHAGP